MDAGAISGCGGGPKSRLVRGASSFSAQNGRSFQWLPRALIVPLPKSHHRDHFGPGKETSLNGRSGAGPSHVSQSRKGGGCIASFGRSVTETMSLFLFAASLL